MQFHRFVHLYGHHPFLSTFKKMKRIFFLVPGIPLFIAVFFLAARQSPPSSLKGCVTDAQTGQPLPGTKIHLLSAKGRITLDSCTGDKKGCYSMNVAPGVYEMVFHHPGRITQRVTDIQVEANKTVTLSVTLDTTTVIEQSVVITWEVLCRNTRTESGSAGLKYAPPAGAADRADKMPASLTETMKESSEDIVLKKATTVPSPTSRPAALPTAPPAEAAPASVHTYGAHEKMARVASSAAKMRSVGGEAPSSTSPRGRTEEVIVTKRDAASASVSEPRAGLLTAGEWNDLHNWNRHWLDLLADGEIAAHQALYECFPRYRSTVLLTNEQDVPLTDVPVQLLSSKGDVLWEARTDNMGKAELWSGFFEKNARDTVGLRAVCIIGGQKYTFPALHPAKDGPNRLKVGLPCSTPDQVDIVWAVDATGSMGDELEYLKTELLDVMGRTRTALPHLSFRMGTVFYRDVSDAYLVKSSALSHNIQRTVDFIRNQSAEGGGDYPEAVHTALEEAIFNQRWSTNAVARICFLVLDASPHQSPDVNASLQRSVREAARRGIRIVPVASSGVQKDTEFLLKFFGLATNGTYVFLTDHSGIGHQHLAPTADVYKIEPLNQLLIRLITEYSSTENCAGQSVLRFGDPQQPDRHWEALYYPNPAAGQCTLDLPVDVDQVALYDSEGKLMKKMEQLAAGRHTLDLAALADGFYTLRILKEGQWQSGKLMVLR